MVTAPSTDEEDIKSIDSKGLLEGGNGRTEGRERTSKSFDGDVMMLAISETLIFDTECCIS